MTLDSKAVQALVDELMNVTEVDQKMGERVLLALGWTKSSGLGLKYSTWFAPTGCVCFDERDFHQNNPLYHVDVALSIKPKRWRLSALCEREPWFCRLETHDFKSVTWGKGSDWITDVVSGHEVTAIGDTAALAVTTACLKAILIESEVKKDDICEDN